MPLQHGSSWTKM